MLIVIFTDEVRWLRRRRENFNLGIGICIELRKRFITFQLCSCF